ncbi:DUF1992 domain-containing protein [Oceanobacillus saliphilus]|uniref:DnaJ family domain-containing protein n=1 Tax=Oceanobacillus saliphilus TaxID=2925834 RepID=UPI00201DC6A8|nr:DUF1992 domain-containing protein [Oceanobacillus saliphilus]
MYIFVEEKIKESIKNGEFENLPGKGKPLDLKEDLPGMPPELRQAYRILKNAGYISKEVESKNETVSQHDLLTSATDGKVKDELHNRKQFDAFAKERKLHTNFKFKDYAHKIYRKLF